MLGGEGLFPARTFYVNSMSKQEMQLKARQRKTVQTKAL